MSENHAAADRSPSRAAKYAFASEGWCAALFVELRARLSDVDLSGIEWSHGETFINPPSALAAGRREIGWHIVVKDGMVDCHAGPGTNLDYVSIIDYESVLPIARSRYADSPEAELMLQRLHDSDDGSYQAIGDRSRLPKVLIRAFDGLHDVMAEYTE